MTWALILSLAWAFVAVASCMAAYNNGVNDGYGFSKEPNNPGYQKAGRYLKKYCAHRWSELKDEVPAPTECDCKEDAAKPYGGHKPDCPNAIPF